MIDWTQLMAGMSASHLMFTVRAKEAIVLEGQPGSALRGALYGVLSDNFCTSPENSSAPNHTETCPVCWLLALNDPNNPRGKNLPRPLTIQPPAPRTYTRDETFMFGVTLIGRAQNLFAYVARAVAKMGSVGIGRGRGRFRLEAIHEMNPLLDASRRLMDVSMVRQPTLQVTNARIQEAIPTVTDRVTLELLSPTRLISNNHLTKSPEPAVFVARLLERCQQLASYYAETESASRSEEWQDTYHSLTESAATWEITYDETEWYEAFSGSRRRGRSTPISGLIGRLRWEGEIGPVYPWLLWGQSLHVGKDSVKGNGWYRIIR